MHNISRDRARLHVRESEIRFIKCFTPYRIVSVDATFVREVTEGQSYYPTNIET